MRHAIVALCLACPLPASAQAVLEPPVRRVEVTVGGGLIAGADLGTTDANLTANRTTRQPFALFSTETRVGATPSFHVRAGYALNRRYSIEGGVVLSRPELRSSVTNDVEGASPLTIIEGIDQYFFDASLVVMLEQWRVGLGTVPFIAAGGGYLRQLHEGLTVIEHGHVYHAGGGVKHWLRARNDRPIRGVGLRADARMYFLVRGVSFGADPRSHLAISGSMFLVF
jgi:hypothetical protein